MKKKEAGKTISVVIWIFLLALAAYIVLKGLSLDKGTLETIMLNVQQQAIETYLPGLTRSDGEEISPSSWLLEKTKQQIPGLNMNNNREETQEDKETSQKIVEENQEFLEAKLVEENQEAGPDSSGLEITGGTENEEDGQEETQSASTAQERVPVTDISLEQFQDFDFVVAAFGKAVGNGCCIGVDDTAKPVLHGLASPHKLRYFAIAHPIYPVAELLACFLCSV